MTNYYLLLEGDFSGFLLLEGDFSGKLIIDSDDAGDGRSHFTYYDLQHELKAAKKREEIKQQEVIDMRLKAQAALIQIREAEQEKGKAAKIRINKLQQEYDLLLKEISAQMSALEQMRLKSMDLRNRLIYLLFSAALPFSRITIH